MATVTLTLIDGERGLLIQFSSDPGLPECEDDETLAQTLGILALEIIKKQFREVTGREPVPVAPSPLPFAVCKKTPPTSVIGHGENKTEICILTESGAMMRQNLNGLKAKIHVAKTQLGLDDDTYRALLLRETGKDSCAKMNLRELEKVLTAMGRQGFKPAKPNLGRRPSPRRSAEAMIRKVEALLLDNNLTWNYAHGMAKRMFGVDQVHWLPDDKLHTLVAALQIYANRKQKETGNGGV